MPFYRALGFLGCHLPSTRLGNDMLGAMLATEHVENTQTLSAHNFGPKLATYDAAWLLHSIALPVGLSGELARSSGS